MSVTGIVAALTAEARTLRAVQTGQPPVAAGTGTISTLPDGNLLIISGMGPEAATRASWALVAAGAQGLVSFGLAGALDPGLGAGAVLLPQAVTDGTDTLAATCDLWRGSLAALPHSSVGGTLLSVAQPLSTRAAKSLAWSRTGARAVDMESFAIGRVAREAGIKFAVARVIIDTAADGVPPSVVRATDPYGEVAYPRLLAGLLRDPAEVFALLGLAQRYRIAMRSLRAVARSGLGFS